VVGDQFRFCWVLTFAVTLGCTLKKSNEQLADFLRLLLLNPVPRSVNKMNAAHLRTCSALHPLKCAGLLENTPVAFAANK
jgi:hypothetical protein